MSAAKPMTSTRRIVGYMKANGHPGVTPRQWHRILKKRNWANGTYYGHWGEGKKGHATPRQHRTGSDAHGPL